MVLCGVASLMFAAFSCMTDPPRALPLAAEARRFSPPEGGLFSFSPSFIALAKLGRGLLCCTEGTLYVPLAALAVRAVLLDAPRPVEGVLAPRGLLAATERAPYEAAFGFVMRGCCAVAVG